MNPAPLIALAGSPNAGKSALFNALTGARQKVANYPGVTVERHSGRLSLADGRPAELLDLPGAYSLDPGSPDEAVTRDVLLGSQAGERRPDALIIVVDAGNLDHHLRFALQLIALGLPVVVALNMIDMAERDGLLLDADKLSAELGVPVVPTVAVRKRGIDQLKERLAEILTEKPAASLAKGAVEEDFTTVQRRARVIAGRATVAETPVRRLSHMIDSVVLHPVGGVVLLLVLFFLMFQAVFAWSEAPISWIEGGQAALQAAVTEALPDGFIRSLLVDGIIAGVGSVVVFLPQILFLFLFILILEASGYMARAAFLMDRLMARVGLNGRAFIPLLSSFACAIPGIMATRTIDDPKQRLTTILIAPMMTCSARLPVYSVIIGAFIPARDLGWGIGLQGLVWFGLYIAGIVGAVLVAFLFRRTIAKSANSGFLMELPRYQMPRIGDILIGLWQRAWVFLRRAGTIIMFVTVALWLLTSYPQVPPGTAMKQSEYSIAGRIASGLEVVVRPIGFNHEMALAIIPAMAAREVAVSALATVYSIDATDEEKTQRSLGERLQHGWSLPTALAFLAWFVFAPQCLSTIAVMRRETNGWRWPLFALAYLFTLAYVAAGATYWGAKALGL